MDEKPIKILYIDDDEVLAHLVSKDFTRSGWEVVCAPDGEVGLALLAENRFDAVALDHFMPGRDGIDVLSDIVRRQNAPPVVYCTGSSEGRLAVAALKAGASDYVIKDASGSFPSFLRLAIEQALETENLRKRRDEADIEVRAARDRALALLKEVDHRIGNSLQLISSFVSLQARANDDEACKIALRETQRRIESVAQVHKRLYTSDDVTSVSIDEYLAGLIEESRNSLAPDGDGPTLTFEADPLRLPPDHAVAIGVIVTELVTNAAKYAFNDRTPGTIHVGLHVTPETYVLEVSDDGVGWDGKAVAKGTGFGRRILDAMTRTLGGAMETRDTGTGLSVTVTVQRREGDQV